ncbi:MAG: RidA family protein [Betaproteobacteria bacterium]|nr:MAG: RidA family protein [Betaproteobacteria bacterium]
MRIEDKLRTMGYELPPPFVFPKENRTGCTQLGNLLLLSGHGLNLPKLPGVRQTGKFGLDITVEEGYATARAVALTMLSTIKAHCGDLDRVKRVLRLFGMVNCTPDFTQPPQVIDGASDLFYELWGPQSGRHARSAVGQMSLPRGMAVEINGEFELA